VSLQNRSFILLLEHISKGVTGRSISYYPEIPLWMTILETKNRVDTMFSMVVIF